MRFKDIDCDYEIVDFKKQVFKEKVEIENGETIEVEYVSKTVLLHPDSNGYKSMVVTKYYDEYENKNESSEDIVEDVVNRIMRWDIVSENIENNPISLSAIPGTTGDCDVVEVGDIDSIEEFNNIYSNVKNELGYKYRTLKSNGEFTKLI